MKFRRRRTNPLVWLGEGKTILPLGTGRKTSSAVQCGARRSCLPAPTDKVRRLVIAGKYRLHRISHRLVTGKEWMHVLYCIVLWIGGPYKDVALALAIVTIICIIAGEDS